ncbi:hypothetical protein [Azospirillum sp. sgz302134]
MSQKFPALVLDAYQQLAKRCASQEPNVPDTLDAMLGNLEHVLACAEIETRADLGRVVS